MKWVFWGAGAVIVYTYLGYVGWLWLRSRLCPQPVRRAPFFPAVSLVMVVRNEQKVLRAKLENLARLDYPSDQLEILLVSDGSTDQTDEILEEFSKQDSRFHLITSESRGKACGLNEAIKAAQGEIVVFTDARQQIEPAAVRLLMEGFADPAVGCVSGELMLGAPTLGETGKGMGLYWRIEKKIRELEAASGSVVGATGALYAVRRRLVVPLPPETILDDVYLPMHVARQGGRVVFDDRARAWDSPNLGGKREFGRKVRTLSGNYQLLELAPWLLTAKNPIRFEFVSHKLLRLVVPFALLAAMGASLLLSQPIYRIALALQLTFYLLSVLSIVRLNRGPLARAADAACTFVLLNTAAMVAFANFVTGRKAVWIR